MGAGAEAEGKQNSYFPKKERICTETCWISVCVCVTLRPFQFDLCIIGLVKL